jgi:putative endonuclease
MSFYIYIIYSEKLDKYYTGSSQNILIRLNDQHNAGRVISTKPGIPWVLRYKEVFETRIEAVRRETQIKKKKSRKYIEWLISSS